MRLIDRFKKPILNQFYAQKRGMVDPSQWLLNSFGVQNHSGQVVNEQTALSIAAVHSCVRVISEGIASMPLKLIAKNGTTRTIDSTSKAALLIDNPNPDLTGIDFRKYMAAVAVLKGNSYAYIFRNNLGEPINLLPVQGVTPYIFKGDLYYKINSTDEIFSRIPKTVASIDMLHFKGMCVTNMYTAISPILYHAEILGMDLAAMSAMSSAFKTGTKKFMLTSEKGWTTEQQMAVSNSFENVLMNEKLAMAVPSGISSQTISLTPAEAGYIEALNLTNKDIARIFGVPASMIGADDGAIKASVEQDSLNFLNQTLNPWAVSIEAEMKKKLLPEQEKSTKQYKHNFNSLLRADAVSRADFYSKMKAIGAYSSNEIRDLEDMNPHEFGDTYFENVNSVPANQMGDWIQAKIDSLDATNNNNPTGQN